LYFSNNQIGDTGAPALANALESNSSLVGLEIWEQLL